MALSSFTANLPSSIQAALRGNKPVQLNFTQVSDSNILSTSSFIYDPQNSPLKSTQQLNVDWSKFENHTFFMSAEAKVNLTFDQIINRYPFDGTRSDVEAFFEKLSGFDRWVFDQFPKYHGQLHFSGTQVGEDTDGSKGTYIIVKDVAGALYPELSKKSAQSVINPKQSSMSVEFLVKLPEQSTQGTQILFQKTLGTHGFTFFVSPSVSTTDTGVTFCVYRGSDVLSVSSSLNKGDFEHVCVVLDREDTSTSQLKFYKNGSLISTSRNARALIDLDIDVANFTLATGSAFTFGGVTVTPTQTFSGTLDEFRIFHSVRSLPQQNAYAQKSLFKTDDLVLYYRFNEPPPPLTSDISSQLNSIVIDSSGNALHSNVVNLEAYGVNLRENASADPLSLMINEKDDTCIVLFPGYPAIVDLNENLLISASDYDAANPNIITRLIPDHYFIEGAAADGLSTIEGTLGDSYGGTEIPGSGKLGNTQVLLSLLYIWARFFDDIKLFVSSIGTLKTIDYDKNVSIPDNFMLDYVRKQLGFNIPLFFNDSTIEQYVRAENIGPDAAMNTQPLKYVQNEILRRVIVNLPGVIRSKGTQHAIKAFLRSVGIDPDTSLRFRERGGPTTRTMTYSRESRREVESMLTITSSSNVVTSYLSGSRLEVGVPLPVGTFVDRVNHHPHGISNNPSDGLWTSGSWSYAANYRFDPRIGGTQSLIRMCVSGSMSGSISPLVNLVSVSGSLGTNVYVIAHPSVSTSDQTLTLNLLLTGSNMFDGDLWHVSFGQIRQDQTTSEVSSSWFLRVGKLNNGDLDPKLLFTTSSWLRNAVSVNDDALKNISSQNLFGSFLTVGSQSLSYGSSGYAFLGNTNAWSGTGLDLTTNFIGEISNVRFWSRAVSEDDWYEQIKNFKSVGSSNPLVTYNYVTSMTGAFEKLRLDTCSKQPDVLTDSSGHIVLVDKSNNNVHVVASGFTPNSSPFRGQTIYRSYWSPTFDEATTDEKIRIRGFSDPLLLKANPWATTSPVTEVSPSEKPVDDVRFSIEFSLIDALNRDIINIFTTLDALESAIGNPENAFSSDYPDLDRLRDVYFNNLKDHVNFKAFFQFFQWFDTSIGVFIEQLVPRKVDYKGINFVVESHMLERHKVQHHFEEMYLGPPDKRKNPNDRLLVQQIVGSFRKF